MLNKIINELEAKIEESKIIKIESTIVQSIEAGRRNAFKSAISIIKQHESEFDKHNIMDFLEYVTKGREVGLTIESSLIEAINKYLNQNYKNE